MTMRRPKFASFLLLPLAAALGPVAHAQMHHVDAPERVTRAIGVYEWTGDLAKPTAARFVPVSLFIDGHLEDAGLYLARPVPFALQPGDEYALEHAGEPEGLLALDSARRVVTGKAVADDNPEGAWYAFGRFLPNQVARPPHLHPSGHLSTIQGAGTPAAPEPQDSRPHMSRRNGGTESTSSDGGTQTSGTQTSGTQTSSPKTTGTDTDSTQSSGSTPGSSGSTGDDDTDRPTLRRRDPSQDAARRRDYGHSSKTSGVTAAGPALGDDPDRPILGRSTGEDAGTPELTGLPADLHQAVGVSDAAHNEAHPFARSWDSPAERADTLAAMEALARTRLAAYLQANGLIASSAPLPVVTVDAPGKVPGTTAPSPGTPEKGDPDSAAPKLRRGVPEAYRSPGAQTPNPAAPPSATGTVSAHATGAVAEQKPARGQTSVSTGRRTVAGHPVRPGKSMPAPALTFGQKDIPGYTLSYGGLPTFIYTAAASIAPRKAASPQGTAVPSAQPSAAFVTLVAQRLATGELQLALSTVTDNAHLDRSPRLRLVDAVDPDDSHRASLLFELRGTGSRQFALYRLTAAEAEETFTTASIE